MFRNHIFAGFVAALLVAFGISNVSNALPQDSKPQAEIVGVAVSMPDADNEYGGSAVMGRSPGVEVNVRIVDKNAFFIGLAEKDGEAESSLKLFSEDGKEMKDENQFGGGGIGFNTDVSKDGHRVTVPFSTSRMPSAGANKLHLRGTVVLIAGTDASTDESSFDVAQGAELKLGNVPVKLSEMEEDPWGEEGLMLSFETNKSLDAIQEVVFLDEKGKEIESSSAGGGSFGFDDQMTYSKSYNLKAKPKKLTARVKYFKSTARVSVPVDLPVTLSLGK